MTDRYILNAQGEPVPEPDLLTWAQWFETADRQLAETHIGEVRVSTIFLGINAFLFNTHDAPLLWETMIFGGPLDRTIMRYTSKAQALAGHELQCARVRDAQHG